MAHPSTTDIILSNVADSYPGIKCLVAEGWGFIKFSRDVFPLKHLSHPKIPCSTLTGDSMSAPDHPFNNFAREDVHKSCKSLETIVNLLNGYCEAADAMVILQKKLVKAIRDAASMKASPTVASNHLSC